MFFLRISKLVYIVVGGGHASLLPRPFTVYGRQLKHNSYTTILVLKPVGIKGLIDVTRYRSVQGRIVCVCVRLAAIECCSF